MFTLRPYQQEAVQATIKHFRKTSAPAVIVLPTGAGKSLVIAELARIARGRVLVLAHVKELVEQNHSKYESYQLQASIYSAGLNRKENKQQVVFGSIQSIAQNLTEFNNEFSLLIIDECHRISLSEDSQYQKVIQHLQKQNPNLKILGLTATPYRLGIGWIYNYHYHGIARTTDKRFFLDCIYELPLRYMIKNNYLTPPHFIDAPIAHYDFSKLKPNNMGLFSKEQLNSIINESGINDTSSGERVTPLIIKQIVEYAVDRQGVMIFASTVEHAKEILTYLPADSAALVTGDTKQKQRDELIEQFKQKQLKYLVNVSVLTTGFDAPHVDVIAVLRPTESVSLYQQIIGRGLRLAENKKDCLILEYAGNNYDLFSPEVGSQKPATDTEPVMILCPACGFGNTFWGRTDDQDNVIEHFGRKCQGFEEDETGKHCCDYRFRFKACEQCGAENDIAARRCHQCDEVIVDPDKKLKAILNLKDAMVIRCSGMSFEAATSKAGNRMVTVTYHDEDGAELKEYWPLANKTDWRRFDRNFCHQHFNAPGVSITERIETLDINRLIALQTQLFRHPDFVIARKQKQFWQIKEKIFDYQGRYRTSASYSE